MNDLGFNNTVSVRLDQDVLQALIYGDNTSPEDARAAVNDQQAALRELQVYRLLRSMVSEMNTKLRGRRERFKLKRATDSLSSSALKDFFHSLNSLFDSLCRY